jgi:restriction system protein
LADKHGIAIVDEDGLVKLIREPDGSVDQKILALLDDTKKYCPKCEGELVLRTAERGFYRGKPFWSCSNFPRCKFKPRYL